MNSQSKQPDNVAITSGQVAQLLNVSPATVRRWVQEGRLQAQSQTIGGHLRFKMSYIRDVISADGSDAPADENWWDDDATSPEAGQTLVEFALVIPLLLMVVIGFFAIGNALRHVNAMNNASDSGAFYAGLGHPAADVEQYVEQQLREQLVDTSNVVIAVTPPTYSYGDPVTVAITKTMRLNAVLWEANLTFPSRATQIVQKQVITPTGGSP